MKILIPLIIFCTLILGGYSAVFQSSLKSASRKRTCYEEEMKLYRMIQKTPDRTGKSCVRSVCVVSNGEISVELQGCGAVGPAPEGCYKMADLTLPYPYCCERYVCPSENETLYFRKDQSKLFPAAGENL